MSYPPIGSLRHRLALEEVSRTSDGGGGATETWSTVASVWASITPASGSEAVAAERIAGQISHVVHIRYRAGVIPAMRFRLGNRLFEIAASIDIDERRRFLKCLCRERDL